MIKKNKEQIEGLKEILNPQKKEPLPKLTLKQERFLTKYIETGNATEAAVFAYKCKDRETARNVGSENLTKLGISTQIQALLVKHGLSRDYRLKKIREISEDSDKRVAMDAIKEANKMDRGIYAPVNVELEGRDGQPIKFEVQLTNESQTASESKSGNA